MVATGEFGVSEDERRGQGKGDQENQGDCGQAVIGDSLPPSGGVNLLRAMAAGVEETMLEGPVFGQIHPAVVLIFPAAVPELANDGGGEDLLGQRGEPKPFMIGGVRDPLSPAVALTFEHLL